MKVVTTDLAPQAIGPYSQAIVVGNLVFCSGQIPLKPAGEMQQGGIKHQTIQVLENMRAVLMAAKSSLDKVVKCTIFLVDLNDFGAVNEIYESFFADHKPARSTIQVAGLPKGAGVEIECVALVRPCEQT